MKPGRVVCAALMPHAPILVPAVGGRRTDEAGETVEAMRTAARQIVRHSPSSLVLISPHSPRRRDRFGLWGAARLRGSFALFGAPSVIVSLAGNPPLAAHIVEHGSQQGIDFWSITDADDLDHGAAVPLWFLIEAGWHGPTLIAGLDDGGTSSGRSFGATIAAAAAAAGQTIAVVASGDMSHRLKPGAPAGYHPRAAEFDAQFMAVLSSGDYRQLDRIDSGLQADAAEDVIDSTRIAAASVADHNSRHNVLSYEGPFGVGYAVAILFSEIPSGSTTKASPNATGQHA